MIIDGTRGEQIVKALENRLAEENITFTTKELERYKGVIYRRQN